MSHPRRELEEERALVEAIQRNDIAQVTRLLDDGVSLDGPSLERPPLWYAARVDNLPAVRALLATSADIHLRNKYGETVLHWYKLERISMRGATLDGLSTAQWILTDRYFAINMSGAHGWTPLHYAALAGQSEMARYLLENAADPTIRSKPGGHTALHYAARSERNETGEWRDDATLVRDLIEYGADIDLPADARWPSFSGEEGESQNEWFFDEPPELVYPIHCAVLTGMLSRVEALLEAGADINARTSVYGSTPLDLAARRGQLEMVRFLLRNGATDTAGCKVAHQNIVV